MGKKKTPLEWAYEHTENLRKAKENLMSLSVSNKIINYIKSLDDSEYKPGYWTILKNISLAYCINPFVVILKSHNMKDTIFLDLFSGSGITPLKGINTDEHKWIVGSPIIASRMTNYPYQKYIFGDINKNSLDLLSQILKCQNDNSNSKIRYNILPPNDANKNFEMLHNQIKNRYVFAYIDPTGFQWNWESMEQLIKFRRFDILMNFQTREIDRSTTTDRIKQFFGPYSNKLDECKNCDEKLGLYIKQLNDSGLYVNSVRIGKDRTNQYYYHLIHISRKNTYSNILTDLKQWIEVFSGETIKKVWNDLDRDIRQKSILNNFNK